jgi:hypothetical protein
VTVRSLALPLAALAAAAACAGGTGSSPPDVVTTASCTRVAHTGSAVVPGVRGTAFDAALRTLLGRRLLVSVPRFIPFHHAMAEQGWGRLANYRVVSQSPLPGTVVASGSVVRLRLDDPIFRGPLGSMVEPVHHPTYARIPDLIGVRYPQAMAAATERSGILVRVSTTGPLTAPASACGLGAFVVAGQSPKPGTRVPWGGIHDHSGVEPGLATVTIRLVSRTA